MTTQEFNELAGRIEGVAQALLRLAGVLEQARIIDGPRLSALWTGAVPPHGAESVLRHSARRTLLDLEHALQQSRQALAGERSSANKRRWSASPVGPVEQRLSCAKMPKVLSERCQPGASDPV